MEKMWTRNKRKCAQEEDKKTEKKETEGSYNKERLHR